MLSSKRRTNKTREGNKAAAAKMRLLEMRKKRKVEQLSRNRDIFELCLLRNEEWEKKRKRRTREDIEKEALLMGDLYAILGLDHL